MSLKKVQTTHGTVTQFEHQSALSLPSEQFQKKGGRGGGTLTVNHQRSSQPLRIMALQNIQNHLPLPQRRPISSHFLVEIDQQRQHLLARGHQIDRPLQHKHQVLHLLVTPLRVLPGRVEIQARTTADVVAQEDLFAGGVLGGYVLGGVGFETVFVAPGKGGEKAFGGVVDGPSCSAEETKEAFAGEPHAV